MMEHLLIVAMVAIFVVAFIIPVRMSLSVNTVTVSLSLLSVMAMLTALMGRMKTIVRIHLVQECLNVKTEICVFIGMMSMMM